MITLLVFVQDLPDGKELEDEQVAPFHTVDNLVMAGMGSDPEHPYVVPRVQEFVLDDGVDIPSSLPAAIPESARKHVKLEIPRTAPNFGFTAENVGYHPGSYQNMLVLATILGYI